MEIKTEADSSATITCPHEDKPSTGMLAFSNAFCLCLYTGTPCPEKGATLFLPVTLRNANRFSKLFPPLPSNRQHLSYGVCLEVRGEIIRTVLCCIVY